MPDDLSDDEWDAAELAEIRVREARIARVLDELATQEGSAPVHIIIEMMSIEAARNGIDSVFLLANCATGLVDELPRSPDHPVQWALKRVKKQRDDTRRR